jgi:uncharacterized cupredoxin-like copper-binding protein/Cu/Ag efflux protein CusF
MKTYIQAALLTLAMAALPPVFAAEDQPTHIGSGKINALDMPNAKVNITHDPIKSLKWPKMTMDFKARDAALLKDLKPGDRVNFELMKMRGGYHIMKISPVDGAGAEVKPGERPSAAKDSHHAHDAAHGHADAAAGQPGDPAKVSRTISIKALDIKYDQSEIRIKVGETIRFVVNNAGKLRHEFILGGADAQRQHAEMMKQMPDMVHEDANSLTLEPGETKSLVWHFSKPGKLEVACHVPGHYEAGMESKLIVSR